MMKKIIINPIFTFILGALIFGGIVGVSAYTIFANDIGYTPKDSTWKKSNGEDITNVKEAIDELYTKTNSSSLNKICEYQSEGSYGNPGEIGALYDCEVGTNIHKNFYILTIYNNGLIDLIMDSNITDSYGSSKTLNWNNAMSYFNYNGIGSDIPEQWYNVLRITIPSATAIGKAIDSNYELNDSTYYFCKEQDNCSKSDKEKYAWLFSNLTGCESNGCYRNGNYARAYWTKTKMISNNNRARYIDSDGSISDHTLDVNNLEGVRPVITVLKSQLN